MKDFWQNCSEQLEKELTPQQFGTWIKPLTPLSYDGQTLQIAAPNRIKLDWVKSQFFGRISTLANQYWGESVNVQFVLDPNVNGKKPGFPVAAPPNGSGSVNGSNGEADPATAAAVIAETMNVVKSQRNPSGINEELTFDRLVTGKANQLARAAAIQVANNPGVSYNPLFIYGGVGLGKTHLIHAIGNQVQADHPNARIRYIRADHYVNDVVNAYQRKGFDDFKRYYHSLDMLLIDDIQFIGGNKARTQEEFFYAFETLIGAKKQIIITSDTYPKEITGIDTRLTSRFDSGLTVAIEPPELEMRVAILQQKAALQGEALSDDVAFFVAKHLRSNVRELEGALRKVMVFSNFHGFKGKNITIDIAKNALKDLLSVQNRQISVENIQKTVAEFYNIKVADMYSKRRPANIARPRQIAMYLAKELTQKSLPEIGELFGGRDHTTVLHAVRKISQERASDPECNHQLHVLEQTLKGQFSVTKEVESACAFTRQTACLSQGICGFSVRISN